MSNILYSFVKYLDPLRVFTYLSYLLKTLINFR